MYGETEDYEITIASPVAVSEFLAQDFNLKINPNPNDGNVKVHYKLPLNETGNFDVVDFLGKTIFSMPLPLGSSMQNINLEKLPAGVYSVRISCNKSYANARLIKQ